MQKNSAISLQNISKVYKLYGKPKDRLKEALHPFKKKYHKDFYALNNINLDIKKGEVLGIVGVNGAGKSTLLKIISGVLTPTTGRVNVDGRVNAILELGSGFKPEMTGRENISLNLRINGINQARERITQEIIDFAEIGEYIEQPVKTYSSGMKARLGFGLATATDPDILIVDEVLAVGDVLFQRKCYARIEKLFKDGKTVIFVSHTAQSVIEFCSRAVLLYDREIIMDDTPKKVTDYYQKLVFSKDHAKIVDEAKEQKEAKSDKQEKKDVFYFPELNSIPKMHQYEDVNIFDFAVYNKNGGKVNVLTSGSKYNLTFEVEYGISGQVSIGAQIITAKGLIITGASLENKSKAMEVKQGDKIKVEYSFICYLTEGTYFMNISTSQKKDDGYKPVCKILDAIAFKVIKSSESYVGKGFVDLNQKITTKTLNNV